MCFIGFGSRGGAGGGGTVTGATNVGAGDGLFKQDNAGVLEFKSLIAGTDITFTVGADDVTIDSTAGGVQYPLSNVLFVNANGNPDTPLKGDIERPYPTYADALADYLTGDVIMLTEDLTESVVLTPNLNIISLGVAVNSGALPSITDLGVACDNVKIYGQITLKPTTGSCCVLSGASGSILLDNCIVENTAGAGVVYQLDNYDAIINGKITNDSNTSVFSSCNNKTVYTGDIDCALTNAVGWLIVSSQNITINGNISQASFVSSSAMILACNGLTINGNIDCPNLGVGGSALTNLADNWTMNGNINAGLGSGLFFISDFLTIRGNLYGEQDLISVCTFVDWTGKGACSTGFIFNTVSDSVFNVYVENYTPQYARAGGGFINSTRCDFDGSMLVNSSPFRASVGMKVFGNIKYFSSQNLLDPDLEISAFFNRCQESFFFGVCELDSGALPICIDGDTATEGNYYGGTFKYSEGTFILGGSGRDSGGGWILTNSKSIIDCTLISGDCTNSEGAYVVVSKNNTAVHTVQIPRLNWTTYVNNQLAVTQIVTDPDWIIVRGGWITNPFGKPKIDSMVAPFQPVLADKYGELIQEPNEVESTSVLSGCELSVNQFDNTNCAISEGVCMIADNSNPSSKTRKRIKIDAVGVGSLQFFPITDIATTARTKIALSLTNTPDSGVTFAESFSPEVNGVVTTVYIAQKETEWTAEQKRKYVPIGRAIHPNNTTIDFTVNLQATAYSVYNSIQDFIDLFPPQNVDGNNFSGVATTLSVQKSEGHGFRLGSNYITDSNNPNIQTMPASTPTSIGYRYQDGAGGFTQTAFTNFISPNLYDDGSGTLQTVPNNNWTIQQVYVFAGGGLTFAVYGQDLFASKSGALSAITTLNAIIDPNLTEDAIFRGYFIVEEGCTDTTDSNLFEWREPLSESGSAGGGSPVITDLQTAYNNSLNPEILTDDVRGAVTVKRGTTGGDSDDVLEIKNGADEKVASIDGEGTFVGGYHATSTGLLTGGLLSVGAGGAGVATTYDISDGSGQLATNTGKLTEVSWAGLVGETPIFGVNVITFIAIDSGGLVVQQSTPFTRTQSRTLIVLGVIVHVNGVNVDTVNNEQEIVYNPMSSLYDAMESLGFFNVSGNVFSANGANLTINKSEGTLFKMGSNYDVAPLDNPHVRGNPATVGGIFQYRFSDGTSGSLTETNIDPNNLDDGAGGLTLIGNNRWSVQRIYLFTSNNIKIQRGVESYATSNGAINGITTEPYVTEASLAQNGLFRGYLVVKEGATVLNGVDAIFLDAGKFGESSGSAGSGSTTTLQDAYDNSTSPEIITNDINGALTIKQGTALQTTNQLQILDNGDVEVFAVDANGDVVANTFNGVALTSGGSSHQFLSALGNYVRALPSVSSVASTATLTVNAFTTEVAILTAQAVALTIGAPTGATSDAQTLIIKIKDNGTNRAITWNAIFREVGVTLPASTNANKVVYIGAKYNGAEAVWDVLAVKELA